ncbi:hypothetical protein N9100_01700 [Gammaproteobacteria bacterium]|nr:hypothetical protein [Gammaproteobacteria bacterium]
MNQLHKQHVRQYDVHPYNDPYNDPYNQKILAYLTAWVLEEVQKYFHIASPERLRVPVPDYRYYHVDTADKHVKLHIFGENIGSEVIDVYFDPITKEADFYCPAANTLIRPDKAYDFDMTIFDQDKLEKDGSIEMKVNFTEGLERVPVWRAMQVPKFDEMPNRPPKIVGGFE